MDYEFVSPFGPLTTAGDVVTAADALWVGRVVWLDRVGPRAVVIRAAGAATPRGVPLFAVAGWPRPGAVVFAYDRLAPAGGVRPWWRLW